MFEKKIPDEIKHDITYALDETKKDNKEKSLTFCKIKGKDKIHTSDYARGKTDYTEVKPCQEKYGDSVKVGDFHTHPYDDQGFGTIPSEADFTGTIEDSRIYGNKQISCIADVKSKYIHCYEPKAIPDSKKSRNYNMALENTDEMGETDPFFRQNLETDFNHAYYDKKSFQRVTKPDTKTIIMDGLGGSRRPYRKEAIEIEKGTFCDLFEDQMKPGDDSVGNACREEVKRRKFLGVEYEKYLPF